ncbi:MAG: CotH kinase family protein [Myxococcota bacterium]
MLALAVCRALMACGDDGPSVEVEVAPDTDAVGDVEADADDAGDAVGADVDALDADLETAVDADDGEAWTSPFEPAPIEADADFRELFRHDRVQPIELRVTQSEWDALIAHMLEYAAIDGEMRSGRYFKATFVYTAPDGHQEVLEDVGFRTRGNTTRVLPEDADGLYHRAHFKLKFDATFDLTPGTPEYVTRDARRFRGLKEMNLKWDRDDDPSQIRELFAYEMFRRAGVLVPATAPVALTFTIGDTPVYFGVYLGLEEIDKPFLARRLGGDQNDGDLYKCLWQGFGPATLEPITDPRAVGIKDWETNYRPAYDLATNEETSHHERLHALIDALATLDGEALATWLDAHFDVEGFLRFLAMNVLVGMPDDYWAMGNNYYLYFGPERATFLPWDYDHGLGGGWGGEPVWSLDGIATADVFAWKNLNAAWWKPGTKHPLVDKILVIPRYRARYVELLRAMLEPRNHLFALPEWEAIEAAQATLYAPLLVNDTGEGEVMEDTGVERAYFVTKTQSVESQLDGR